MKLPRKIKKLAKRAVIKHTGPVAGWNSEEIRIDGFQHHRRFMSMPHYANKGVTAMRLIPNGY